MLNALNFVKGAVATKDLQPILTHFHVYGGRIQGYNGRITIDAPCPELKGMDITVPADKFLQAIRAAGAKKPELKLLEDGRLLITAGSLKVRLPLVTGEEYPKREPSGERVSLELGANFVESLRMLRPFVSEDASREWSMGMLIGPYAYATNNVAVVRIPMQFPFSDINLPVTAVDELIRIGITPKEVALSEEGSVITFFYPDSSWLACSLLSAQWPLSVIEQHLEAAFLDGFAAIPAASKELKQAVEQVRGFAPDPDFPTIHFKGSTISTAQGDSHAEVEVSGYDWPEEVAFHAKPLGKVLQVADYWDLSKYPAPTPFCDESGGFRGVFMGIRTAGSE